MNPYRKKERKTYIYAYVPTALCRTIITGDKIRIIIVPSNSSVPSKPFVLIKTHSCSKRVVVIVLITP